MFRPFVSVCQPQPATLSTSLAAASAGIRPFQDPRELTRAGQRGPELTTAHNDNTFLGVLPPKAAGHREKGGTEIGSHLACDLIHRTSKLAGVFACLPIQVLTRSQRSRVWIVAHLSRMCDHVETRQLYEIKDIPPALPVRIHQALPFPRS